MKNCVSSFLSRLALPGLISLILSSHGLALADTIATVMINNNGVITANGSDTGNINIATDFVIDMYTSVADGAGDLFGGVHGVVADVPLTRPKYFKPIGNDRSEARDVFGQFDRPR